jgi:hypothetical protein
VVVHEAGLSLGNNGGISNGDSGTTLDRRGELLSARASGEYTGLMVIMRAINRMLMKILIFFLEE